MPRVDKVRLNRERLEQARRASAITLPELAKRARVSARTLWLARTSGAISLAVGKRLAKALKKPLDDLLAKDNGGTDQTLQQEATEAVGKFLLGDNDGND